MSTKKNLCGISQIQKQVENFDKPHGKHRAFLLVYSQNVEAVKFGVAKEYFLASGTIWVKLKNWVSRLPMEKRELIKPLQKWSGSHGDMDEDWVGAKLKTSVSAQDGEANNLHNNKNYPQ